MDEIKLDVQIRDHLKKRQVKALRQNNLVPGVIYGGRHQPTHVKLDKQTFERIRRHHHGEIILLLNIFEGEKKLGDFHAIVKEMQHHPVSDEVIHIDFKRISMTEKIEVKVPINAKGEAIGVKKDGGALEHVLWELTVECLPTQVPEKIVVDVTSLEINQAVHVKDIVLPEGLVCKNDPEAVVIAVAPPMKEEVVEPSEEGEMEEPEVIKEKKKEEGEGEAKEDADAKQPEAKEEKE